MARMKRVVALAGGVSALALAGQAGLDAVARRHVDQLATAIERGGAIVDRGSVSVDPFSGMVRLSGLAVRDPSGVAIRIGAVRVPGPFALVPPALAAADVTLEDVTIDFADQSYTIKALTFSGTDNAREELAALFDKASSVPLSERLRKVSAQSVTSPEIVMKQKRADVTTSFVYRDVRVDRLVNGVAGAFSAGSGAFASQGGEDNLAGTFGATRLDSIDLVQIARVYNEQAAPGETELKTVYGSFSVEDIKGTAGKGGTFSVARISGRDARMKPGREPWLATLKGMAGERDAGNLPPSERAKLINAFADMMESFSIGLVEATSITGSDSSSPDSPSMKIARIAYQGASGDKPNVFGIEGIEVNADKGHVRVGALEHSGWSYGPTLQALRETFGKPDVDMNDLPVRRFVPKLGTLSIRDVDVDLPDPEARDTDPPAPNMKGGLKLLEIGTSNEVDGIPTTLHVKADHLTAKLPQGSTEQAVTELLAMGYKDVDLSAALDGHWDEGSGDLTVNTLSLQGANMGSVGIRATLGNISKDVFSTDSAAAQVALLGATAKTLSIAVENKGLIEKALEREARKQKKSSDQLRKEFGTMAQMAIPAMLGGTPQARQVAGAVAKFLVRPNRLIVDAKARSPMGLGLSDFMGASGDPQAVLAGLDITAKAE